MSKTQPRTILDFIESGRTFDLELAANIIAAVGDVPCLPDDAVPDHLKADHDAVFWPAATLAWLLNNLVKDFRWNERRQHLPPPKEVEARTRKIASLCEQIMAELVNGEGEVADGLGAGYLYAAAAVAGAEDGAARVQGVAHDIRQMQQWASFAAARAAAQMRLRPSKRGRPSDPAFDEMLDRLSGVYYHVWGRRPGRSFNEVTREYGGPYVRFVRATIGKLAPEWGNKAGIDGALIASIKAQAWPAK